MTESNVKIIGCTQNWCGICLYNGKDCKMGVMPVCEFAIKEHDSGKQVIYPEWYAKLRGWL